jgi:glycine hydroxymethyltransferase
MANILTVKYAEGYPKRRYYSGQQFVDQIEIEAINRAKKIFRAEYANVQPHSGSQANQAVYYALLNPGDKVLGMRLDCGGHLTHGAPINFSGQYYRFFSYGVDRKTGLIDFNEVEKIAKKIKPKMIICGASSYPRIIDFKKFSQIARQVKAFLVADIAHIAGLIVAGLHPHCFPFSDVATTTTHKTLRGPRGGLILAKNKFGAAIDKAVFPGIQGGPLEHIIAAKAVCFKEAQKQSFFRYQKQVIKNAQALASVLLEEGMDLVTGGTDNHLVLVDLTKFSLGGKRTQEFLEGVGIYANRNVIPYDKRPSFDPSGIRLGSPALTSRGFKEAEMKIVAKLVAQIIKNPSSSKIRREAKKKVKELVRGYPIQG